MSNIVQGIYDHNIRLWASCNAMLHSTDDVDLQLSVRQKRWKSSIYTVILTHSDSLIDTSAHDHWTSFLLPHQLLGADGCVA